jgi:hypothetical protein
MIDHIIVRILKTKRVTLDIIVRILKTKGVTLGSIYTHLVRDRGGAGRSHGPPISHCLKDLKRGHV